MRIGEEKPAIEEIKSDIKKIEYIFKNNLSKELKYDNDDKKENKYSWWIYIFIDKESKEVLKIGKDTSRYKSRPKIQHYSIEGVDSTLAKDLFNKYVENENFLHNMDNEKKDKLNKLKKKIAKKNNTNGKIPIKMDKIKELKEDEEICECFEVVNEIIKEWMEKNLVKHIISMSNEEKIFILNFLEAYLQMKYEPLFEGFKKQNIR